MEPRKSDILGPTLFRLRKAAPVPPQRRGGHRPGGVEEHGAYAKGSPGTREILSSPRESGTGVAEKDLQAHGGRPVPSGSEDRAQRGTAWARDNRSPVGRTAGGRSILIVPASRGNPPEGPRGGKRDVGPWNR
jgi:hypothetical protein